MKAKKVVFLSENVSWGGSELLWSKTVVELQSTKIEVALCVPQKLQLPDSLLQLALEKKIVIQRMKAVQLPVLTKILNRLLPYKLQKKEKNAALLFLENYQPNLLVINQGYNFNSVDYMQIAVRFKIKYITISHAVNEFFWPNLTLRQKMSFGFQNSLMNFFVSQDNLETTEKQLGHQLKNTEIIRNPFNVAFQNQLKYPETDLYQLAFVGRYDFNAKGQDVLLQVLSQQKWKNRNLIVNFYGSGNDVQNLHDIIAMYCLENVVVHSQTETLDIWKKNHALILTSRFEGLPIVIVEAMLCRRTVIVTDVSGSAELIVDNETGFIAAAPRAKYVDEALERAWTQRENWEQIGIKARQEIEKLIPENPTNVFANKIINLCNV